MTIAVSLNLPDGVIFGVDSAITMTNAQGAVVKVYENAEKLFQLGDNPIGVMTYGMGGFGERNNGSYLREFELADPKHVITQDAELKDVVEELRKFFIARYTSVIIPTLEKAKGKRFEDIPEGEKPFLGLVVGGFSPKQFLSEVWIVLIPFNDKPNSAVLKRKRGDFGGNWFAMYEPIWRYTKGYDRNFLNELLAYVAKIRGSPFSTQENKDILKIVEKYEYIIPFGGMPIEEGVANVKSLVDMVVAHHRFVVGAAVVGGKTHIGRVTYKGEKFEIIQ